MVTCHLQTVTTLFLLFLFGLLLFLFLLWLLWLTLPKLCWIIVVRVGNLVVFLILGKWFQFFTIEDDVGYGFVIYGLSYVEESSLYAHFLQGFNHKWALNFGESFPFIDWDDLMVFLLQFVNILYHIDLFAYIEESLHSWDKPNLIMVYDPFHVLLDAVC